MIDTIELPALTAIGITVAPKAPPEALEAAWTRLFETDTGASGFIEWAPGDGSRFVGYLAAARTELPQGLERRTIPAGRTSRLSAQLSMEELAGTYGRLRAFAAANGLAPTGTTLTFGFRHGRPAGIHELHLGLEPERLRLG